MAHMAVGDLDGTFAWLDKMYEERPPWLIWMNVQPRYDGLRGDPRFQQLLRKIGFKESQITPAATSDDPRFSRASGDLERAGSRSVRVPTKPRTRRMRSIDGVSREGS